MGQSAIFRSFAGGELAPGLGARADLVRYGTSARTCRNFLVRRHGGASNRSGTKYLATAKLSGANRCFVRPFVFPATDASFAIECSDNYFRFFRNGAAVLVAGVVAYNGATAYVPGDLASSAGVNYYCIANTTGNAPPNAAFWYAMPAGNIYEIPTPYSSGDFQPPSTLGWSQQGTVVTITHLNRPPMELAYTSATRWVLTTITTGPSIGPPTAPAGVAGAAGTKTFKYVVCAAKVDTYEESNPSTVITVAGAADPTDLAPIALNWTAPAGGAAEYYVYSDGGFGNGTFGYLGTATGQVTFNDVGQVPDFSVTPPIPRVLFASPNNYPAVSTTHQQRRVFGGSHNDRELVSASQTGFKSNFTIRSPLQDDDGIQFRLTSNELQPVQHLVGLKVGLVVLTSRGEWVIRGDENGTLIPTAINPDQHGYVGSDFTRPVVIGNTILFVQGRGSIVRDLRFDVRVEGLGSRDLTIYSSHLFRGYTVSAMAHAQVPDAITWVVRSDGTLLGLTYIPEEDVWGWHRHDTDGFFEDVCVIPEGAEDAVYVVVKRVVAGSTVRYIERLASRDFTAIADAWFVDAGLSITNAVASTSVTGLGHLAGKTVSVFADGAKVAGTFVVSGNAITLPSAKTRVLVGLPITAQLETLDLDFGSGAYRDAKKRVGRVSLLLEASMRGFKVGPDSTPANLKTFEAEAWQVGDTPYTGKVEQAMTSFYGDYGHVFIQHTDPTPLTVLAILPHVEGGG